ncbi:MAG: tetratricopeptide repeat-containing sulfotransferase family protein [Croceibacterium sp.]
MNPGTVPSSGGYDPRLLAAAQALNENELPVAEAVLRELLKDDPFEVRAIRMLAELAGRLGRNRDAEALLRRALELSPEFTAARSNLALVLYRTNRPAEAIEELQRVKLEEPDGFVNSNLEAAVLGRVGAFDEALELYRVILDQQPNQPRVWMSFGHTLKTVGRQAEGIDAYRRALELMPELGEAWWSLANLKTVRFDAADIARMEAMLDRPELSDEDRFHLEFALGKAREDRGEAEPAFAHYAAGNALRRKSLPYKAAETTRFVNEVIGAATPELFAAHSRHGCQAHDPIFIVGMPRAGSTLIEQILSSHSMIEGTSELLDIPVLARELEGYPQALSNLDEDRLLQLGEEYLRRTRIHRRSDRPLFIDKLPNNWVHVPFIRLILPNARIIDARRHPLGCCFSNFKQHFARGQGFTYELEDVGRYYRDYVRLMAHVDRVQPGRVHRVIYERMVEDTEAEVRALLDYCGLPFETGCLAFHRTDRPVRTASSEQVRQPIYREATEAWKPYEPWLGDLRQVLGEVLETYPEVPDRM